MGHSRILYLSVGCCNKRRGPCGFEVVSLPLLTDITGPITCVSSMINNNLLAYVSVTCDMERDFAVSLFDFTTKLSWPTCNITQLSVPFNAGNVSFVLRIAVHMPNLVLLELIEKPHWQWVSADHVTSYYIQCSRYYQVIGRQVWSNATEWSRHLALMTKLKALGLRTSTLLTGNSPLEHALVVAWTEHHRSLKHLALWHGFGSPGCILKYWDCIDGEWASSRGSVDFVFCFFSMGDKLPSPSP